MVFLSITESSIQTLNLEILIPRSRGVNAFLLYSSCSFLEPGDLETKREKRQSCSALSSFSCLEPRKLGAKKPLPLGVIARTCNLETEMQTTKKGSMQPAEVEFRHPPAHAHRKPQFL